MPEDLGFEQRVGNRAAVERNEALRAPAAGVVNCARDKLLASSGFTLIRIVVCVAAMVSTIEKSARMRGLLPTIESRP